MNIKKYLMNMLIALFIITVNISTMISQTDTKQLTLNTTATSTFVSYSDGTGTHWNKSSNYRIGRVDGSFGTNSMYDTYRSQYAFTLPTLPSYATFKDAILSIKVTGNSGSLANIVSQSGIDAVARDGYNNVNVLHNTVYATVAYNTNNYTQDVSNAVSNAMPSGNFYVGALSNNESTNLTGANVTLKLIIEYTVPVYNLVFKNNFDAGSVNINGVSFTSGTSFPWDAGSSENILAIDHQYIQDTKGIYAGKWYYRDYQNWTDPSSQPIVVKPQTSFNLTVIASGTYTANFLKEFNCSFSNSFGSGQVIVNGITQNTGYQTVVMENSNVSFTLPTTTPTYNGNTYQFGYWIANGTVVTSPNVPTDNTQYIANYSTVAGTLQGNEIWISTLTLRGNVYVTSGIVLTVNSGSLVNLNGYSIISSGGTITNNGTITGLRTYLQTGSTINGYCGSIQTACNNANDGDRINIVAGSFTENISVTGKNNLTINGQGINQTNLPNSTLSIYSSSSLTLRDFTCQTVNLNNCPSASLHYSAINTSGQMTSGLYSYNSGGIFTGTIQGHYSGYYGSLSTINVTVYDNYTNTNILNNAYGVWATNSSVISLYRTIPYINICGNSTLELSANTNAQITAYYCSYPSGFCRKAGNVTVSGTYNCSGTLGKISSYGSGDDDQSATQAVDSLSVEYNKLNANFYNLQEKVDSVIALRGFSASKKFLSNYINVTDGFKTFIGKYPESGFSRSGLTTIVHIYRQLDDFESIKSYLQTLIGNTHLKQNCGIHGLAKRFMVDYYCNQKDYANAFLIADDILLSTSDTTLACDVLYDEGLIYTHNLNQRENAIDCFSKIINNYPGNVLSALAENELNLLGVVIQKKSPEIKTSAKITEIDLNSYPNPFNPTTTINYQLPETGKVSIVVYDLLGRSVAKLVNEVKNAGRYMATFDGSHLSSGYYFVKLDVETLSGKSLVKTLKIEMLK